MPAGRPGRKAKETALGGLHNTFAGHSNVYDASDVMEPSSELSALDRDDDSDFEQPAIRPVGRGRSRGRGRGGGDAPSRRGRKAIGSTTAKDRRQPRAEDLDGEGSLFEIVKSGRVALTTVVDDWIDSYKQDRDTALLGLIQFFIHCSGCKGRISVQMYQSMEHAEIIRKMTEEFDEDSGDYPLIMSGPQWKKFKNNFCDFIMMLVRQCQYSIIYDQYMMDNVISLLTGLTDSQVRAFRHTSTLASMKLMTALVDVALNLSINLDHTQRQYEAERAKNRSKQASERLEMLMTKRQEVEENQEEIRNMLTYIFKGVFVHRYRDTQPEIRGICMAEIGVWMKRYPGMFLDDSYLKYVGWTLYDRMGEVRHCCLRCLLPLYDTTELQPKLELFTNRFKDRIVEMTLDKEYDVAVQAVKLVIEIFKFSENVLADKDCENVYELVYSSHRAVAQAAGEFLNAKLFSRDNEEAKNMKSKKGKKRSENTPLIRDLVQFFIESELHEHGAYLVDSLWEINDMLKDWECMTDLLLEEPGKGEEAMDDRQETSLIEIMVCCVKQSATGEYPVGRGPTRKLTTKESKQVLEDKTKLTEHFIVTLPQLLAKYNVDAEKVANLLQISLYFDLEIYTTSRQEKNLDTLLRHICDIVDKHTDSEVLENCSKVLENFCSEEFAISGKCNVARSTLIDHLVQRYKEAFQDFFQEGEEPDEDDAYALMASLKRIYAFYCCHDLNPWGLWDSLFAIVKGGQDGNTIPEEIVCKAIACCSQAVIWFLDALDKNSPDKPTMKELKKRLNHFMKTCHQLMYHQQDKIQEDSYITICDMLVVFSKHLGNVSTLAPLVYDPDKNLQGQLSGFLNDKVFIEDDDDEMDENQKIVELHKRRNFLASFCKLVVYNVVNIKNAADMFKYYMRFYNDYGDIIKATLGKAREINKVSTAKTLASSLTQLFTELQQEQGWNVDRTSEGYQAIKELARRFSLSFGLDQLKNREAVAAMHREGITFSLTTLENTEMEEGPPPNISFLEILAEFSSKLMRQDKRVVLAFLDKQLKDTAPGDESELWAPYFTYRGCLLQGEADVTGLPTKTTTTGKRGRGAKRKQKGHSTLESTAETTQWVLSSKTPSRNVPGPLTSTVIKKRRVEEVASESGSEEGSDKEFQGSFVKHATRSSGRVSSAQKRRVSMRRKCVSSSSPSRKRPSSPMPNRTSRRDVSPEESRDSIEEFESPEPARGIEQRRDTADSPAALRATTPHRPQSAPRQRRFRHSLLPHNMFEEDEESFPIEDEDSEDLAPV